MGIIVDDEACRDIYSVAFSGWRDYEKEGTLELISYSGDTIDYSALTFLTELNELCLQSMFIADDDLALVARLSKLEILRLDKTAVSDRGLAHLNDMQSLRYLSLVETDVSSAAVQTLQRALPHCKIRTKSNVIQVESHPEHHFRIPDYTLLAPSD